MCFIPLIALFRSRRPNAIEFCDSEGKRLTRISKGTPVPIDGTFSTKQGTALSKILIRRLEPGQTLELWSESANIKIHSSSFLLAEKEPIVVKVQGGKQKERVCNLSVHNCGYLSNLFNK